MALPLREIMQIYLAPCLADVLIGFGLSSLLEFSRLSPDSKYLLAASVAVLLVLGIISLSPFCKKIPPWLAICNTTYSLILTLALSLNLLAQLCPPNGKELSLLPVYALLCVPRTQPSGKAILLLAGGSVVLLGAFLVLPTSRHTRPVGAAEAGNNWMLALSLLAGAGLQTFSKVSSGLEEHCVWMGNSLPCRLWQASAVVCKGLLLVLLGTAQNTTFYHFLHERPNTVPTEIFIAYGTLLLFGSMQTAAVWFELLRQILGSQAKWRLVVRIQHIIYALIVAAAWVYPLQLHVLRLLILAGLLALNCLNSLVIYD